jgi:hypothetical protein
MKNVLVVLVVVLLVVYFNRRQERRFFDVWVELNGFKYPGGSYGSLED